MNLKKIFFNNLSLKITALLLALFVWILITGKQRTYQEKSIEINVEYFNVPTNADVKYVRPEKVRIKIKGPSNDIKNIVPEDFKLRIDLNDLLGTRNFFTEDYLEFAKEAQIVSIHPKMIEITIEEFMSKEVPVRIRFKGRLKRGIRLLETVISPDRVKIFGYKSKIEDIHSVYVNRRIDLSKIDKNVSQKLPLQKVEEIIRFEDSEEVEVKITVDNRNVDKSKG